MSIWTNIKGTVKILKEKKISVKDVFAETLTDEICIDVKTEDCKHYWNHNIYCNACIDGEGFIKKYEDLLFYLHPMKGGVDLTCTIRLYA